MYCKDCEYYKPEIIEKCTNKHEPMCDSLGGRIPRRYEVVGNKHYGHCMKYIIDGCCLSFDKEKHDGMVLTWDGSSYMSGADVSENFGCIHFKQKETK